MKLKVITTKRVIEHDVDWVELNTPVGNMVIQEGHAPIMIELMQGNELLFQISGGPVESILIVQGIAHVTRAEVKVLLPMDL